MKLVTKPSPCFITPTAYLEKYASQSNNHLCLAHIVDRDPVYADFYKKMSDRGDLVIMDNSVRLAPNSSNYHLAQAFHNKRHVFVNQMLLLESNCVIPGVLY